MTTTNNTWHGSSGAGLRLPHIAEVLATRPALSWLEIHPENFLSNPHAAELLTDLSQYYPISFHSVGISIGSASGLREQHLERVRAFADRIRPIFISGHLAWSLHGKEYLNDLLPLPYTKSTLKVLADQIHEVQDYLGRPYLLENPASYLGFRESTMSEHQFLSELVSRTGCRLLCDLSNAYLSAHNMGYDIRQYINSLPVEAVAELHLGGYTPERDEANPDATVFIDTHAEPIAAPVWELLGTALQRFGPRPVLIEWDNNLPPLATLLGEVAHAERIASSIQEVSCVHS